MLNKVGFNDVKDTETRLVPGLVRADLHDTTLSHTTSLRQACDMTYGPFTRTRHFHVQN